MVRANRLIHALTVSTPGGHFWDDVYNRVPEHQDGCPFNILLTYFYIKCCTGCKTAKQQATIIENHKRIVNGGMILIDSGVYSFNSKYGMDIRSVTVDSPGAVIDNIIEEGKKSLPMYREYANSYADFLRASEASWDYAIDFDADIFLGSDLTDEIHEEIIKRSGLDRRRFIRVVHHLARPDATTWCMNLCEDTRYEYIALDGGSLHKRNPDFYRPLVNMAHAQNKKVHVFAISSPSLTQAVDIDTFDSTSHLSGGRFGNLFTPWGNIDFSRGKIKPPSYEDLSSDAQEDVRNYVLEYGLTIEEMIASPYSRNLINIWYMNKYWDLPYVEKEEAMPLFNILETK